jgi:uncharacterized protein YkwD
MKRKRRIHHYIVPSKYNQFKPYLLRLETTVVLAFVVASFFVITQSFGTIMRTGSIVNSAAVIASVLADLANADRSSNGVGALAYNETLAHAAQMKAQDMAARSYFAHNAPDGTEPWHWFERAGYQFTHAGENLAVFFSDSVEVERAWMNSPTHRENIVNGNFTEVGIGLAEGIYQGRATTFVVQMFGTPAYAEPVPELVEEEPIPNVAEEVAPPVKVLTKKVVAKKTDTFIEIEAKQPRVAGTSTNEYVATATQPIITSIIPSTPSPSQLFWRYLTSPRTLLSWVYFWLSVLVLIAMFAIVIIEAEYKHWKGFMYGAGLLGLMITLTVVEHVYLADQLLIL